jgi:hypothetical protein
VRAVREDLRLLIVDASKIPRIERDCLLPEFEDIRDWYRRAAESGAALAVLCGRSQIELYSTSNDRAVAFRPPLVTFIERTRVHPELARVRVLPRRGLDVARHLFELVSGMDPDWGGLRANTARIAAASQLAGQIGALSPTIDLLFRAAGHVAERVRAEIHLGMAQTASRVDSVDTDVLRIIDEELLNWKRSQVQLHRSLSLTEDIVQHGLGQSTRFDGQDFARDDEAPSGTRIRVAKTLRQSDFDLVLGIPSVLLRGRGSQRR